MQNHTPYYYPTLPYNTPKILFDRSNHQPITMWKALCLYALGLVGSLCCTAAYDAHMRAKIASSIAKGERRARERQAVGRLLCDMCRRPTVQCVCEALPPSLIPTATDILVLQHPSEFRKKSVSTVPLLSLVLQNVQVVVGESFDLDIPVIREAVSEGNRLLLLFPGEEVLSLDSPHNDERRVTDEEHRGSDSTTKAIPTDDRKVVLILVDGTWTQAGRMIRNSPELLEVCQRVQFTSVSESIYHAVRKEPKRHCISTLEACSRALTLLEPHNPNVTVASKHLYGALRQLVRIQLQHNKDTPHADPRFVGKSQKKAARKRRRLELEQDMFGRNSGKEPIMDMSDAANCVVMQESLDRKRMDGGAILRSLHLTDAPFIDSRWPYRSQKSLQMIQRQITTDAPYCLGIECDGKLCAFILRHPDGALGMLHVEEGFRRQGLGTKLLQEATRVLDREREPCFAFILDRNEASERLFAKQGWVRVDPEAKRRSGNRRSIRKWIRSNSNEESCQ
eukprot:scaffold175_cov177-Amphora_coffeaeformis.AAC.24